MGVVSISDRIKAQKRLEKRGFATGMASIMRDDVFFTLWDDAENVVMCWSVPTYKVRAPLVRWDKTAQLYFATRKALTKIVGAGRRA